MAKRRSNREGTIYKEANGTWRAQMTLNGRRLSYRGATQTECREWLRGSIRKVDEGYNFNRAKIQLKDFLAEWLVSTSSTRRRTSNDLYQYTLNREVLPYLGSLLLYRLQPDDMQAFYARRLAAGVGEYTVRKVHKVLHVAFNHAVSLKLLPRNPLDGVKAPRAKSKEMAFYDDAEAQALLQTAVNIRDQYYPLYFLAIHSGMRQAELLGLRWDDLDWNKATLNIQRQLIQKPGGGYEFQAPKTQSGKRTILLGKSAIDVLRSHYENQQALTKKDAWEDTGLIFTSRIGSPIVASNLRRAFRKLLQLSGLPKIRFHDLRHTAASLMLNNGIPVLVVSKRLGHGKSSITLDTYGHLIPGKQEDVAKLMDDLLTPLAFTIAPKLHQQQE
jgi:integrase